MVIWKGEAREREKTFEEIMAENFHSLQKETHPDPKGQRVPNMINPKSLRSRHTAIKMSKFRDNSKGSRRKVTCYV